MHVLAIYLLNLFIENNDEVISPFVLNLGLVSTLLKRIVNFSELIIPVLLKILSDGKPKTFR